jgi:glycosyltransferase involved in cell wall biosynthesis
MTRLSARSAPVRFPSVSVVIPTHDRPELLLRAIRSVLGQDYQGDIECVVVFDQREPTRLPLDGGRGRVLRVVTNDRTPGLAGARNAGAVAATGELLGFLDDDDEWLPHKLRRQVQLMQKESAPVVACGLYVCRGDRQIARNPKPRVTFRDLLRSRHMALNACTVLVERSRFLTEIGFVDELLPGSYGEDYEWLLRAARTSDIIAVPEPLVRIYWHGSSYFARDWRTIADANLYLLDKHPDFASERVGLARISGQISIALAASGRAGEARRWARKAMHLDPRQTRAYLALLVSTGMLRADTVLRVANTLGRGV